MWLSLGKTGKTDVNMIVVMVAVTSHLVSATSVSSRGPGTRCILSYDSYYIVLILESF